MTAEQVMALIAGIAALISLVALLFTIHYSRQAKKDASEANKQAEVANSIAVGQAENELRRDITNARNQYEARCERAEDITQGKLPNELSDSEKKKLKPILQRMYSSLEDYLNTYENACSKYVDKKIDVNRFKKSYVSEIRNLFEPPDNAFKKYLHPEGTSRYKALWKVYKEWNDLENN